METFELKTKVVSGVDCLQFFNKYQKQGIFIVCDKFLIDNGLLDKILAEIDPSNHVEVLMKSYRIHRSKKWLQE